MTFGNEELCVLEFYAKQQKQVYQDACDFGVVATDSVKEAIRKACRGLADIYKSKSKKVGSYPNGGLAKWTTFVPIERADYFPDQVTGLFVEVVLVETNSPRYPAYFTIRMKRENRDDCVSYFKPEAKNPLMKGAAA